MPNQPPLGPIGTRVLFDNEHIRVWAVEHQHPYLIVPISRGRSVMKWPDGRERQLTDVPGDIKYREATGGPHELFNLEDADFHCVLVEIKAGGKTA
jgi:beta-alanine degradation protein BauB